MTRLLVFDLDDTLYPEHAFARSGFAAVGQWLSQRYGTDGFAAVAERLFDGGVRRVIFDQALAELGLVPAPGQVEEMVGVFRAHEPRIELFPDASRALEALGSLYPLALITDGYLRTQQSKVRALGIERRFQVIVYSDAFGREHWKPSATPFMTVMEKTGFRGPACVYISDNPAKDFIAPNRLGWRTIRIRRKDGEYRDVESVGDGAAHLEIASLDDLQATIEQLGSVGDAQLNGPS